MHFQIPKTRLNFSDMKEIVSRTSLLKFWSLYNLFPLKQTQTSKHLHFKLFNLDYVIGVEGGPPFATEQLLRQYSVMSSPAWNHLGVGSYQWAHIVWPVFKIFHSMFDSLFGLILLSANTYFEIPGSIPEKSDGSSSTFIRSVPEAYIINLLNIITIYSPLLHSHCFCLNSDSFHH